MAEFIFFQANQICIRFNDLWVASTFLPLSNLNAPQKNVKWLTHLTKGMKIYLKFTENSVLQHFVFDCIESSTVKMALKLAKNVFDNHLKATPIHGYIFNEYRNSLVEIKDRSIKTYIWRKKKKNSIYFVSNKKIA